MRYEVRLIVATTSEISLVVETDGDADDAYDRAVQLLRDGDVLLGVDYEESSSRTEFLNDAVRLLP